MMNSWYENLPKMQRRKGSRNPLYIHPADASELGLEASTVVKVRSAWGEAEASITPDDGMLRGVVRFVVAGRAKGDDEQVEGAIATALGIVLVCSAAVTLLILLSADAIAAFYDKPIARALQIMAFSAPFMATTWVFVSAIRALRIVLYGVYVMSIAGPLIFFLLANTPALALYLLRR